MPEPEIHKKRKRKRKPFSREQEALPKIDPLVVKSRLNAVVARVTIPGICLFLVVASLLVFSQGINHAFVNLNDDAAVPGNPLVSSGLGIKNIFLAFLHSQHGFYTPLTTISHMVDSQVYGIMPGGHHFTSILLHAATAVLLFLTLRQMTNSIWRSAFIAAVFAIHPLHVESVAWVSERGDVLCGFFFVLTIAAYVRYVYRPLSLARYLEVAVFFTLGLLSSPTLVALPFVLLLLDYWPLGRFSQLSLASGETGHKRGLPLVFVRLVSEKVPFFALSFLVFVITLFTQHHAGEPLDTYSLPLQVNNVLVSSAAYIGRTFYPFGLTVFYPQSAGGALFMQFLLALILLGGISAGCFLFRKKYPYLLTGWLWYLGMLAPAIAWGAGGLFTGADHYTYLPQIGLCFMAAWAARDLLSPLRYRNWVAGAAMSVITAALILISRTQSSYWSDSESLWSHAIDATQNNYIAENNLGLALAGNGKPDDAIPHYGKALEILPDYAEAHNNLGIALVQTARVGDAIPHYEKALQIRPDYAEAQLNLGIALAMQGKPGEAIAHYEKALQIRPDYAEAHINLGLSLTDTGDLDGAINHFEKTLQIRPSYAEAHYDLGIAYTHKGDMDTAIDHYQKALQIRPVYAEAHSQLGILFYQKGDLETAINHYQKALEFQPSFEPAHFNLGIALVQKGEMDEAINHFNKALEIGPDYAEIHTSLGAVYYMKKQFAEAQANFEKALQASPKHLPALRSLAWLLATCPNATLRDGLRAVELGEQLNQLTGDKNPVIIRTLAAAYAEAGRFQEAAQTARRALKMVDPQNDPALAGQLQKEINLYDAGTPYHETQ